MNLNLPTKQFPVWTLPSTIAWKKSTPAPHNLPNQAWMSITALYPSKNRLTLTRMISSSPMCEENQSSEYSLTKNRSLKNTVTEEKATYILDT